MAGSRKILRSDFTRVWIAEGGAGPGRPFVYQETMRAGELRWPAGEPTDLEVPDGDEYGDFVKVDQIEAAEQKPTLPVVGRFPRDKESVLTRIRRRKCTNDIQVHIGTCQDPRDFDAGWDKVLVLETARLTDFSTDQLGALQSSERNPVNESGTFTGLDYYEVFNLDYAEQAPDNIAGEIVAVAICDRPSCQGKCGEGSDGCQRVFLVTVDLGSLGGVGVTWSRNGGSTWNESTVAALGGDPSDAACVGRYLVITSQDGESHAYAVQNEIVTGDEAWAEVTSGYVSGKGPNAIAAAGATNVWIVGQGGYIYWTDDITSGVEVQDAGNATVQNLLAVHALNADEVLVGGASNVVLHTTNGGETWTLITGPAAGVAINTVWMRSSDEWIVGTAGGRIYSTDDGGETWSESGFSGQGTGVVEKVFFATAQVGYMTHTLSGVGRLFRTINGGQSWVLQDGIPDNDRLNAVATCANPNRVFVGGLGANATDGIAVKGA